MVFIFLNWKYWDAEKLEDKQIKKDACKDQDILQDTVARKEI